MSQNPELIEVDIQSSQLEVFQAAEDSDAMHCFQLNVHETHDKRQTELGKTNRWIGSVAAIGSGGEISYLHLNSDRLNDYKIKPVEVEGCLRAGFNTLSVAAGLCEEKTSQSMDIFRFDPSLDPEAEENGVLLASLDLSINEYKGTIFSEIRYHEDLEKTIFNVRSVLYGIAQTEQGLLEDERLKCIQSPDEAIRTEWALAAAHSFLRGSFEDKVV